MEPLPGWAKALLAPRGVALVGASDDPSKVSGRALRYLLQHGYAGAIHPVNSRRNTVQGTDAYSRIADVPDPVDLAVISLPAKAVGAALRECGERGIATAILYASGFSEVDGHGAAAQRDIAEAARMMGIRLLGPNCLGSISFPDAVTTTFTSALDEGPLSEGPVALISQSGAFASFVYGTGRATGLGFRFLANTGNEADLTVADLLQVSVELPDVAVVLMHLEGVRDFTTFERAAVRAQRLNKPVVTVKVGRTSVGAAAARAHTGSVVGDDATYEALFRRTGIHRVQSMEALVDAGRIFSSPHRPEGRRATIISISGGTGVLMADACIAAGLDVLQLDERTRSSLAELLPWFASTNNPVDLTGGVLDDLDLFSTALDLCAGDTRTDLLLVAVGNVTIGEEALTDAILETVSRHQKFTIVTWVGGSGRPAERLSQAHIPIFPDPTRAVSAAALAVRHFAPKSRVKQGRHPELAHPIRS